MDKVLSIVQYISIYIKHCVFFNTKIRVIQYSYSLAGHHDTKELVI
jgi:hypothetical protein